MSLNSLVAPVSMVNCLMVQNLLAKMPVKVCSDELLLCCYKCHYVGASVSMLQLIQEVKVKVGKDEDSEDYEALERILRSHNFSNLMQVSVKSCYQLVTCDVCVCVLLSDVQVNETTDRP